MWKILLLVLMLCPSIVSAQAVWKGRQYSHPVCSNPNCRMCNSINNQLASQRSYQPQVSYQPYQPTFYAQPLVYQPIFSAPSTQTAVSAAAEPTPLALVPLIFELLQPSNSDTFIDIGCGDGRVLREAQKHPCKVLGIDLKPTPVAGVNVITGDARDYDYSDITLAYIYLYPDLMSEIIDKLPSCTKIVSYSHTTPNIEWKQYGHFFLGTKQ